MHVSQNGTNECDKNSNSFPSARQSLLCQTNASFPVSGKRKRQNYLFLSFAAALRLPFVFSAAFVIANDTGVKAGGGAGVDDLEGAADRLCAICALTK